jgi:hypothetical protein
LLSMCIYGICIARGAVLCDHSTVHELQRGALLEHGVAGQHLNAFPAHPHAIALSTRCVGKGG